MSKGFKKPFILSDTHLDDLAIRGVKYIKTAHFGDLFETRNAPYDYVQKIKKLKLIKTVITHKVDRSNIGTVNLIVRQHQKLLRALKDYGSSSNTALKKTARLIRNPEEVKVNLDIKSLKHFLRYHRDVENLHLEEGVEEPAPAGQNEEEEEDKSESEDELEKIFKLVKKKAWRLRKLKTIEMEGEWEEEFNQFLTALEENSQALISLKEINLKSIIISRHFNPRFLRNWALAKYIKQIEVAFGDLHSTLMLFVMYAALFPGLEKLTGVVSLQALAQIDKLGDFQSLKHLKLFFHKDEQNPTQHQLVELLHRLRLPETLETADLHFTELDAASLVPLSLNSLSFNLPKLHSISVATTVSPHFRPENATTFLKMAFNNAKNLKNFKLEIESLTNQKLKQFFSFRDCLDLIEQTGVQLDSLSLKLPCISFENISGTQADLDKLSHLSLTADNCIQDSDQFNSFLAGLNPATIKSIVLNEIEESTPEKLVERLTILQKYEKLEKLSLVYKNMPIDDNLTEAFGSLLRSLPNLTYFVFRFGRASNPDPKPFQVKMNDFFLEKPDLGFSFVDI